MPYLTVAGHEAHYVQRLPALAGRPPVVFVHGAGGTHQHWLYQVRDLSMPSGQELRRAPTFALDLPGHGRSRGPGRESVEAYGDWVLSFLDVAGLEQAVIVGHSMGGAIALDMALRFPHRVAGLGLVATGARLRVAPAILQGIQQDRDAAVRLICEWAFGPEAPPEMVRLGQRQMSQISAAILYGDFVACDGFDVGDRIQEITLPTLVLCGSQDRMTPVKYSTFLRERIPGSAFHLVEGAGHMVMVEQPQAVVGALVAFLERL